MTALLYESIMTLPFEPLKERWLLRLLILTRKVWWPLKEEKEKKVFRKSICPCGPGIEPPCVKGKSVDRYINWTLLLDGVDFSKVFSKTKASILPPLHKPQIETIDIGHKSLHIIVGIFIVFRLYFPTTQMPIYSSFHTSFMKKLSVYIGYSFKTAVT